MFKDMTVCKKEIERLEELGEMVSLYCVPDALSFPYLFFCSSSNII